jgi:hypothetical protein
MIYSFRRLLNIPPGNIVLPPSPPHAQTTSGPKTASPRTTKRRQPAQRSPPRRQLKCRVRRRRRTNVARAMKGEGVRRARGLRSGERQKRRQSAMDAYIVCACRRRRRRGEAGTSCAGRVGAYAEMRVVCRGAGAERVVCGWYERLRRTVGARVAWSQLECLGVHCNVG